VWASLAALVAFKKKHGLLSAHQQKGGEWVVLVFLAVGVSRRGFRHTVGASRRRLGYPSGAGGERGRAIFTVNNDR
jgi:hypothetical protein